MKRKTGFSGIFVLIFCFFFVVFAAYAFTNQVIIENAKKYLGYSYKDWQSGQCKMFVRQIVSESGGYLGPGYRFCYLDVGKEVLPADVEPGDIIQLDNEKNHNELIDRNGNSGRNYTNGMHTVIILEKIDGSNFKVIESNVKPLTVGIREWNPWETANKHNLHVHFYRLWDESVTEKPVVLPDVLPNIPEPFNQPVIDEIAKLTSIGSYILVLDASKFGWTRIQVPIGKYRVVASGEYDWDPAFLIERQLPMVNPGQLLR